MMLAPMSLIVLLVVDSCDEMERWEELQKWALANSLVVDVGLDDGMKFVAVSCLRCFECRQTYHSRSELHLRNIEQRTE